MRCAEALCVGLAWRDRRLRAMLVQVGIDVGRVVPDIQPTTGRVNYVGRAMNRAARIAATAVTGQVGPPGQTLVAGWVLPFVNGWMCIREAVASKSVCCCSGSSCVWPGKRAGQGRGCRWSIHLSCVWLLLRLRVPFQVRCNA